MGNKKVIPSKINKLRSLAIPLFICFIFFVAYSTLSIIRHQHYQSLGFDLGINDQIIWHYSRFEAPISTVGPIPFSSKFTQHIELVYPLIALSYWIWNTRRMLLLVQAAFVCFSGISIYLLAKKHRINPSLSYALLISYLMFYGVQNALWFDLHSASFAAAFLAWFIYYLDCKKNLYAAIFFLLAITAKEDIALLTLVISFVFFLKTRLKLSFWFMFVSAFYLGVVFFVYYPHFTQNGYIYGNNKGILSNVNPMEFANTSDKRQVLFYSFASFGFLPVLAPLYLLPSIASFFIYFVVSDNLRAQTLFMHYRIELAPLMLWGGGLKQLENTNGLILSTLRSTSFPAY